MEEEQNKPVMAPNPADWKNKPMGDYSPLHRICSYLAMFPPNIAGYFINRFTEKGDTVFDPFCGRGTTPLEAVLQGREAIGSDLNNLAIRLTKGKTRAPPGVKGMVTVMERIKELEEEYNGVRGQYLKEAESIHDDKDSGQMVGVVFGPDVLQQLLFLRKKLIAEKELQDQRPETDDFLIALILGAMHGQTDSYFSVSMPNTFSMSPTYIKTYVDENNLEYEPRNVFNILRERAAVALSLMGERDKVADIRLADAKTVGTTFDDHEGSVDLLFSSPPYLKVIKYGLFNWIRLWFLGIEHKDVDAILSDNLALDDYVDFMGEVMDSVEPLMSNDGVICWVIGDVKTGPTTINLAQKVWEDSVNHDVWERFTFDDNPSGIVVDAIAPSKKVTRIWNSEGHEIYHIGSDEVVDIVSTQSEAQERVNELGKKEYYSKPVGTSGQATPDDRILMLKRVGARPYDSHAKADSGIRTLPNPERDVGITTEYFEWVMNMDEERQRYLRRFNKLDLTRSILSLLDMEMEQDEYSSGSTVKTKLIKRIHQQLHARVHGVEPERQPLKKHDVFESALELVGQKLDKDQDISTSSTITKIGLLRLFLGVKSIA